MYKILQALHIYEESTPSNILINVDLTICHSLQEYWATHPKADVTDISFKVQSLLEFQKRATKSANTKNQASCSKQ